MSKTPIKAMLSTEQRNHINGILAWARPGTRYGDMSVERARTQLLGDGFDDTTVEAMLDLRKVEPKVSA